MLAGSGPHLDDLLQETTVIHALLSVVGGEVLEDVLLHAVGGHHLQEPRSAGSKVPGNPF